MRAPRWMLVATALLSASVVIAVAARADIVLHEFIPEDPVEDLRLGATTTDGTMAAAIQTESGTVGAPDPSAPDSRKVYGGSAGTRASGSSYRVDSNTSQPDVVSYDDPFTPEITPFKREFAYDAVTDALELVVADPALSAVPIGGAPTPDDDQFYADLTVELVAGDAVRIPTVGPGTRLLGMRTEPATSIEVLRDGADNWFVRAQEDKRVRLVMQLAIDRGVFGSDFADTTWEVLAPHVPATSPHLREAVQRVAETIGVTREMSPGEAMRAMVTHFRGFSPSDERPKSSGLALFEELVTSQKGVCRHRSFAFVVMALALGLPARMVRNEAHAWVEVSDALRWHRIDLGGAAGRVDIAATDRPAHIAPRDPYAWPSGSDSGEAMAEQARAAARSSGGSSSGASASSGTPAPAASAASPSAAVEPVDSSDPRPPSDLTLGLREPSAVRGSRLPVFGAVEAEGAPCALARVDLHLVPKASSGRTTPIALGALVTGDDGRYEGQVAVPYGIPVGDYDVVASTPGSYRCGRGASR